MSELALFLVGGGVTVLVLAAVALLVYAAILDGRDERAAREFTLVTDLDTRRRSSAA